MKRNSLYYIIITFCIVSDVLAQEEVYPTKWWTGMKMNEIQLLVRSQKKELNKSNINIPYPGIHISKIHTFENPRYLAIDISIDSSARPGNVPLIFKDGPTSQTLMWKLEKQKEGKGKSYAQGINSGDFIDLIITDRFSNGDITNDKVPGMRDQWLNRDSIFARHGGDFQGIINHIDYFKKLGVTALWLLPVMENDRNSRTEHGYGISNHYKIDPRYGGEKMYKKLSDALHQNGMKLIMDAVYNHIDQNHFLELDPPAKDWVHRWPAYTQTNYREQTLFDPYAAPSERKIMSDGWFDKEMPDINHHNPYMANYLIQNVIWHIQEYGIDGVRIDTYTYSDLEFANRCNRAIMDEYPGITLFGETRVHGTPNQSYFNENIFNTSYKSNLPGSVDFQCLYYGIIPALTQRYDWHQGVDQLYTTLSQDFLNKNPMRNVLLLDNHDEPRFFSVVNENAEKQKMGFQWLLTCRGIPQLYYGSEVLLKGFTNPDGLVRADFPGGWKEDQKNAFTGKGLTKEEAEVQELVAKLGNFRKSSSALKFGKMMHYTPSEGLYTYFRYDSLQTIMCIMNTDTKEREINFGMYQERTSDFKKGTNILTGEVLDLATKPKLAPMKMWILELKK